MVSSLLFEVCGVKYNIATVLAESHGKQSVNQSYRPVIEGFFGSICGKYGAKFYPVCE